MVFILMKNQIKIYFLENIINSDEKRPLLSFFEQDNNNNTHNINLRRKVNILVN